MLKLLILIGLLLPFVAAHHDTAPQAIPPPPLNLRQIIDTCAAYYHIPTAVIIGVATEETGVGRDGVGKAANNLFGIKKGHGWHGAIYQSCKTCAKWRQYSTPAESVQDFCKFITKHYPYHLGKPTAKWYLNGYGNSKYKVGFFTQYENK